MKSALNQTLCRRVFSLFIAFFIILTFTFILMKWLPGDPFSDEKGLSTESLASLAHHYHFDDPVWLQYGRYLSHVFQGDLGMSLRFTQRSVLSILQEGFPVSALLGSLALVFALMGGVLLGICSALINNRTYQIVWIMLVMFGLSLPSFILAPLLQYWFAVQWHWFPIARWGTSAHLALPVLSLSLLPMLMIAQFIKKEMAKVLQSNYIRFAYAKGLSKTRVMIYHALPNALLPLTTYVGMLFANILTGSFAVEKIFGIPGLGHTFVSSITARDYPVIMGVTLLYSTLFLSSLFVTELIYGLVDPKLRMGLEES